jgi:hypothetical protein
MNLSVTRLRKRIAAFRAYMRQPATNGDLLTALATMAGGGFAVMGITAAILAYFNVFPRPH